LPWYKVALIRIIIPKLGQERSLYIGLALYSFGYILFAFASQSWMMFAFMVPYSLGGIAGPALQGIMSNQVPAQRARRIAGNLNRIDEFNGHFRAIAHDPSFCRLYRQASLYRVPGSAFFSWGRTTFGK
jgi:MFS transporter, DHA1 family, tetracycline resistance protein